jgi:cobalt-zinc-cadmium efflux system protein
MPHAHDHGPLGHHHVRLDEKADQRRLVVALALLGSFMLVEVVVGVVVHSLALLADAAHMLTDTGALGLALFALWLARRPARGNMTFGFRRAEILSAQANGLTLFLLAVLVVIEGVRRLVEPPAPGGLAMVVVAAAGIVVNLLATWQLASANRENMNIRGAYLHVLTDLYAFAGTAVAGVVILATGFDRADGIAALGIAASMLWAAYGLLRDSGRVFLEAAPAGLDVTEIGQALASHPAVASVHDLHIWAISSDLPSLSAHVLVRHDVDCHQARQELELVLRERYGLEHTTLQVEHEQGLLAVRPL